MHFADSRGGVRLGLPYNVGGETRTGPPCRKSTEPKLWRSIGRNFAVFAGPWARVLINNGQQLISHVLAVVAGHFPRIPTNEVRLKPGLHTTIGF